MMQPPPIARLCLPPFASHLMLPTTAGLPQHALCTIVLCMHELHDTVSTHLVFVCLVLQRQQGLQLDHNAITATRSAGKLYYGSHIKESTGTQLPLSSKQEQFMQV